MFKFLLVGLVVVFSGISWAQEEAPPEKAPQPSVAQPRRQYNFTLPLYFGIGVYYNTASELTGTMSATTVSGSGYDTVTLNMESSFTILGEVGVKNERGFSFAGGFSLDSPRNGRTISALGGGGTATAGKTRLLMMAVYGDLIYGVKNFYVKSGLNFSIPHFTNEGTGKISGAGDLGAQIGAGYSLDENIAIELIYRKLSANATLKGTGVVGDLDSLRLEGTQVGLKYGF